MNLRYKGTVGISRLTWELDFGVKAISVCDQLNPWKDAVSKTYVIADVRGRFSLLLRAMEAISCHARERRKGSLPEHKIVILGDTERGPESEQIVEYLTQEQLSRRSAPIILGGGPEYAFVSTDLNPNSLVISIFDDDNISGCPVDFIRIDTR